MNAQSPGVNFIDVFRTCFSYESLFKTQTLSREKTFVQKMLMKLTPDGKINNNEVTPMQNDVIRWIYVYV